MAEQDRELMQYERDGNIVTIRFNRPEKLNAFSDEMVIALTEALRRFDADEDAHVAVLCGNGRAFSTGADVRQRQLRSQEEFRRLGGPQGFGANAGDLFTHSVNWKPVITAAHGYVLGLATGIVLESDLIVAEEGTQFQITETSRGLGGAKYWGLMQFRGAAAFGTEVALTGRYFSAEEAFAHGVINRLAPKGALLDTAYDLARAVCANPPLSVRATVRTRRWYLDQIGREITMQTAPLRLYLTEDFQEAARAFVEKRPAGPFQGR
ncbi:MAG: enoyl-CoA hydratase/isomerase family protein [Acidimicrobiales bacterium]